MTDAKTPTPLELLEVIGAVAADRKHGGLDMVSYRKLHAFLSSPIVQALSTTSHATSAAVERVREEERAKVRPAIEKLKAYADLDDDTAEFSEELGKMLAILNRADGEAP